MNFSPSAPSTSGPSTSVSWSGKSYAIVDVTKPTKDPCVRPWRYSTYERSRLRQFRRACRGRRARVRSQGRGDHRGARTFRRSARRRLDTGDHVRDPGPRLYGPDRLEQSLRLLWGRAERATASRGLEPQDGQRGAPRPRPGRKRPQDTGRVAAGRGGGGIRRGVADFLPD